MHAKETNTGLTLVSDHARIESCYGYFSEPQTVLAGPDFFRIVTEPVSPVGRPIGAFFADYPKADYRLVGTRILAAHGTCIHLGACDEKALAVLRSGMLPPEPTPGKWRPAEHAIKAWNEALKAEPMEDGAVPVSSESVAAPIPVPATDNWVITDAEAKLRRIIPLFGRIKLGVDIYQKTAAERYGRIAEILFDDQWRKDNKMDE